MELHFGHGKDTIGVLFFIGGGGLWWLWLWLWSEIDAVCFKGAKAPGPALVNS